MADLDPELQRRALELALEGCRNAVALVTAARAKDTEGALALLRALDTTELRQAASSAARIAATLADQLARLQQLDPETYWSLQAQAIVYVAEREQPR